MQEICSYLNVHILKQRQHPTLHLHDPQIPFHKWGFSPPTIGYGAGRESLAISAFRNVLSWKKLLVSHHPTEGIWISYASAGSTLRGKPRFSLPRGAGWGFLWDSKACSSRLLSPPASLHRCWSYQHFPVNVLHTKLKPRVCYLGISTCVACQYLVLSSCTVLVILMYVKWNLSVLKIFIALTTRFCACMHACSVTQTCRVLWHVEFTDDSPLLLCPLDSPDKNIRVGCHFLFQGIFLAQGLNLHLLHWQEDSLPLSHVGSAIRETGHLFIYFVASRTFPSVNWLSTHALPIFPIYTININFIT